MDSSGPVFVTLVFIIPMLAFWAWMFRDMANNGLLLSRERTNWMFIFVILNVFGAAFYYITIYRDQHR